ncbi:hypothetical protein R83H12_02112 [Fibrobacteria bacterium R8-3-H12]
MKKRFPTSHPLLATSLILFFLLLGCGGDNDDLPSLFCGGQMFDPETQTCSGSTIISGGGVYSNNKYSSSYGSSSSRSSSSLRYPPGGFYYGNDYYETVSIGSQTWLMRNLNYATSSGNSKCYEEDDEFCQRYGRLYDWEAANAACPAGWRLPTNADWNRLIHFVEDGSNGSGSSPYESEYAGMCLKEENWNNYNNCNYYSSYFMALPGGDGNSSGNFSGAGYYGYWWSATESNYYLAYSISLFYSTENINWYENYKSNLYSVRCLLDR